MQLESPGLEKERAESVGDDSLPKHAQPAGAYDELTEMSAADFSRIRERLMERARIGTMNRDWKEEYYQYHPIGRLEIKWWEAKNTIRRAPEKISWWVAWHMPRRVALFVLVRLASAASSDTFGNQSPDQLTYPQIYKRWERGYGR